MEKQGYHVNLRGRRKDCVSAENQKQPLKSSFSSLQVINLHQKKVCSYRYPYKSFMDPKSQGFLPLL